MTIDTEAINDFTHLLADAKQVGALELKNSVSVRQIIRSDVWN